MHGNRWNTSSLTRRGEVCIRCAALTTIALLLGVLVSPADAQPDSWYRLIHLPQGAGDTWIDSQLDDDGGFILLGQTGSYSDGFVPHVRGYDSQFRQQWNNIWTDDTDPASFGVGPNGMMTLHDPSHQIGIQQYDRYGNPTSFHSYSAVGVSHAGEVLPLDDGSYCYAVNIRETGNIFHKGQD